MYADLTYAAARVKQIGENCTLYDQLTWPLAPDAEICASNAYHSWCPEHYNINNCTCLSLLGKYVAYYMTLLRLRFEL